MDTLRVSGREGKNWEGGVGMEPRLQPVGVFDSGLGGLSVLRALRRELPHERFLYYGDSANVPYGTKPAGQVRLLASKVAALLVARGVKALVVACNTATGAAIADLRRQYPDMPVIGVEPALKPAALRCRRVLVMATPLTLRQEKFQTLLVQYAARAEVAPLPCPGLMEMIERGQLDGAEISDFLTRLLAPYRERPVDAVVLGCTHYPFVRRQIAAALGYPVQIFDGSAGTARQTRRRLAQAGLLAPDDAPGGVVLENSRRDAAIQVLMRRLLELPEEE